MQIKPNKYLVFNIVKFIMDNKLAKIYNKKLSTNLQPF